MTSNVISMAEYRRAREVRKARERTHQAVAIGMSIIAWQVVLLHMLWDIGDRR